MYTLLTMRSWNSARILLGFLAASVSTGPFWNRSNQLFNPLGATSQAGTRLQVYHQYTSQIFRAIHIWPPEYVALAGPLIACLILGPTAINLRVARELQSPPTTDNTTNVQEELLKLVLTQFAKYWEIGSLLLGGAPD